MSDYPPNLYRISQSRFAAIPGSPWVYWATRAVRNLFETLQKMDDVAPSRQGLATADNFRFLRFWWEVGVKKVGFGCKSLQECQIRNEKWYPYMKGGPFCKWYGNQEYVINYGRNGYELKAWADPLYGNSGWSRIIKSTDFYFRAGVTYSYLTSGNFSARISPGGFIFDVAGSTLFPDNLLLILAVMNSSFANYGLKLINPTVNFQVGDLARLPVPEKSSPYLEDSVVNAIRYTRFDDLHTDTTYDFVMPGKWEVGIITKESPNDRIYELEKQIDREVYRLYGLPEIDQVDLIDELARGSIVDDEKEHQDVSLNNEEIREPIITPEELAVRWISYAVGIVIKRFLPGPPNELGNAIYRREDFAIGSLPTPDEAEFNELVGAPERFDYIDEQGGRHVFSRDVETQLRALADPDGVTVLDEGHPDDLPVKVLQALELMLGEQEAAEVVAAATGEAHETLAALRKFLEKDFFTKWHLKWYRKRPVYWLLQSPKKLYSLYLFHERLTKDTLYLIQGKRYLEGKLNLTRQALAEKLAAVEKAGSARERRALDKEAEELQKLLLDLEEFAKRLKAITDRGYTPHIDDGVILNMAPLHEIIPSWSKEPKKYWERLEHGDYDWAHLAMDYRPEQVRKACKTDKSLAIAHGHEEWYEM